MSLPFNETAILLSSTSLRQLSLATREEVMAVVFGTNVESPSPADADEHDEPGAMGQPGSDEGEEEGPADLSRAQMRKFLERCSDKTKTALRAIAEADQDDFALKTVAKALGIPDEDPAAALRGVWGGLTKRVRTVLGDENAYLIWWEDRADDWHGHLSPMSHKSLREALGVA